MAIRNPIEWIFTAPPGQVAKIGTATPKEYWQNRSTAGEPVIKRIGWRDIRFALDCGIDDFKANRTDIFMLRATAAMPWLLAVHLGVIAALF